MLKQICIYAENKKRVLEHITGLLEEAQINIWGSVTNDNAEFGVTRMVVSDTDKAMDILQKDGYMCRTVDVLGVEVSDEVGNLHKLLHALGESNINVDYIYLSFSRDSAKPIMVFHAEDAWEVEDCLKSEGFTLV